MTEEVCIAWRLPGLFHADVEKVNDEIKTIGEEVMPDDLIGYAEANPDSELYKCFDWDNDRAAAKYRHEQAKLILRSIVVLTVKPDIPPVREYSLTPQKSVYAPTRRFLVRQNEYQALLQRALGELQAFRQKYSTLSELDAVFEAIDKL